MKKLALGTLMFAGLLAACGGGGDDVQIVPDTGTGTDASTDTGGGQACNPTSPPGQQGCATGQKCTWIQIQDTPEDLGKIGCVPDGTVALGAACTQGAVGETTGYDDCAAGGICVNGTCSDVCGFAGGANDACATGYNCTRYSGLWANGEDDPLYGACNPACNPITQEKTGGGTCGNGQGCYLLVSQTETIAVCAGAGTAMVNTDLTAPIFANSCVPGAQPRRKDGTSQTSECGGLCNPADVYKLPDNTVMNAAAEGGLEIAGNATAKDNCQTSWNAPPVTDTTAGESCRYWWAREPFDALSPYSNTVGWCFQHNQFLYDTNNDMTPDAVFPLCRTLTTGDVVPPVADPPHNDAMYFWCIQAPAALQNAVNGVKKSLARQEPKFDRLGNWRN